MRLFLALFLLAALVLSHTMPRASEEKSGTLQFKAGPAFGDKTIPVHYFVPSGDPDAMPVQFVLHGASRNAGEYLDGWKDKARKYGVIVVAPEFSAEQFKIGQYTEGLFLNAPLHINPPELTLFSLIDKIFASVKSELHLTQEQYNIFGHSAGGQFVHRYLQFYHSPHVNKSVAANAGWYTYPDEAIEYPYGIKGLFENNPAIRGEYYAKELLILLGTADTLRTNKLRVDAPADRQGANRLERGRNFFATNKKMADAAGHDFNWKTAYVPGAGHQHELMSAAAADILYGAGN